MKQNVFQIIIAVSDETERLHFKNALEELKQNTSAHMVTNGEELMTYLKKKNITLPHLLFLDLNMPRKNGLTCLKEIKEIEKLKNIPIAIYSTSSSEKDRREAFLHGANIYIQKPDDFTKLKMILEKAITTTTIYENPPFNPQNFILNIC
jgi:CheY-like chemotaxis protein